MARLNETSTELFMAFDCWERQIGVSDPGLGDEFSSRSFDLAFVERGVQPTTITGGIRVR